MRYRKAEFEAMGGLRRITFNENILIGDRGVTSIARELTEDLWVKGQTAFTGAPLRQMNKRIWHTWYLGDLLLVSLLIL